MHLFLRMILMKESVLSLKKQDHNIGFPTFKLPSSTKYH